MLQSNRSIRLAKGTSKSRQISLTWEDSGIRNDKEWNNLNPRQLHSTYMTQCHTELLEELFYISGKQINYSCSNYHNSLKVYQLLSSINGILVTNSKVGGRASLQEKLMQYKFQTPTECTFPLTSPWHNRHLKLPEKNLLAGFNKDVKVCCWHKNRQ